MKTRKDKAGKKKGQVRDLPKKQAALTEAQTKSVKGGTKLAVDSLGGSNHNETLLRDNA